ncbi:hypothetical protein H310_03047 [Aphanomyces invadans]|uniref:protein-disulfide reductase n=1 Tax=Aphanomyces invadans TaxID=157072 RepID=A0A024UKJ6_9STRA|nr:hypothetical protein H310_03047 [Aphanomyces invadans]ETW06936.1 hypothetical protein H310_03047 [Aphanomyces invadans]|eukprot:XP_008865011.1 hypothetical protein H310_03047 [Aphanomyces invadans]
MRPILLDFDATTVTIFWENTGAEKFDVQWKKVLDEGWTSLSLSSSLMKKKNMEVGTMYHFRVKAADASSYDDPLEWTHPEVGLNQLAAPQVVMAFMPNDVTLLSATLQWKATNAPFVVEYLIMDGVSDWITATSSASSTAMKKNNIPYKSTPYAFRFRPTASPVWSRAAGPLLPPVAAIALTRAIAPTLLTASGSKVASPSLGGKVIGLYFSAHWCGPCRQFTPMLAQFYQSMQQLGKPFEVVFVSADRSQRDFDGYFREMPWLAVPYDSEEREALEARHEIRGIPTFKIINSQGAIVDGDARQRPLNAATFDAWYAQCYRT